MRYRAYLNNQIFFDSYSNIEALALASASISYVVNAAGTFNFSIPPKNEIYDELHLLVDYVKVYRDDDLIFYGRVFSIDTDTMLIRTVNCEGCLAFLNDSVFRPEIFNGTIQELIERLVSNHNAQVSAERQIQVGNITIQDDYVYRAYETYETTISRLQDLKEAYGGYMSIRISEDVLYFDWIDEIIETSSQTINFGDNILTIDRDNNADTIISVLIPLGAETEDENGVKSRLTIESVNHGNDYIVNDNSLGTYGRIVGVNIWDDVTTPAVLLNKATKLLNQISLAKTTINVTAVDLSAVNASIDDFRIAQSVKVTSQIHGIDGIWFIIKELTLNLLNPATDVMTLGDTFVGYIEQTHSTLKTQKETIEKINKAFADSQTINNVITQLRTSIEQTSEAISLKADREIVDSLGNRLTSAESQILQTAGQVAFYFGEDGKISSMFQFKADGSFIIGKADDVIKSVQKNNSWSLIDNSNNELLKADTGGVTAETVKVKSQVEWLDGQTIQWSIRKGQFVPGKGVNLNVLWLGG